jgi:hypothetical protein
MTLISQMSRASQKRLQPASPCELHETIVITNLLPLLPRREERAGERRAVSSRTLPLSPTLSPLIRGEREKEYATIFLAHVS